METHERRIFILLGDWTWWAWTITAVLLTIGLCGWPAGFVSAMALTALQCVIMLAREKSFAAFPVQLRIAYLSLLLICFIPQMRWLYWLPTVGTYALVIFGYCLMARMLFLLPWNRHEAISADLLRRTFASRPDLSRVATDQSTAGCAGGLCTIDAQVRRASRTKTGAATKRSSAEPSITPEG